jgi:hypothetical protein
MPHRHGTCTSPVSLVAFLELTPRLPPPSKFKGGDAGPESGSRIDWAEKIGWAATAWEHKAKQERTWRVPNTLCEVAGQTGRSAAPVGGKETALNQISLMNWLAGGSALARAEATRRDPHHRGPAPRSARG